MNARTALWLLVIAGVLLSACSEPASPPATAGPVNTAPSSPTVDGPIPTQDITPTPQTITINTPKLWPGPLPEGAVARLGDGWPYVVETSPDGALVAVGLSTGVEVFDAASLELLWAAPTTERVSTLAWTGDGERLAGGLFDGRIAVWTTRSGMALLDIPSDNGTVVALDWTPDSSLLVASGAMGISTVRDGETGAPLNELAYREKSYVSEDGEPISNVHAALSPDGHLYATHYDFDGSGGPRTPGRFIIIWDVDTGKPLHAIESESSVSTLAWSSDNQLLATGSTRANLIELWQVSDGRLARKAETGDSTWQLFWSRDSAHIAVIPTYTQGTPAIFDSATLSRKVELGGPGKSRWFVDWSQDGARIALLEDESTIVTYDTSTGAVVAPESIGGGRYFVMVGDQGYYNPVVKIWDTAAGAFGRDLIQGTVSPYEISWPASGDSRAAGSGYYVWQGVPDEPDLEIRYAPYRGFWEGRCDDTLRLPGDEDLTDSGACPGARVESPDGSVVAIAYNTETDFYFRVERAGFVAIYDAATGDRLRVLRGHSSFVRQLVFSPDGKYLATGSDDGTVIVWEIGG